ncbi:MAG TPA: type II secretion system protein GspE [Gammaproteobacteria bacterium]|nr:type II secretion system protein GspE [Gammaproteobacteria bacterium]
MAVDEIEQLEEVHRTRIGAMTYISPNYSLIGGEAIERLETAIHDCLADAETKIVIDLASVSTINNRALNFLLEAHRKLKQADGWLKVVHAAENINSIFKITGLSQEIEAMDAPMEEETDTHSGSVPRLGDLLLEKGLVSEAKINEAIQLQETLGKRMGQIIVDKGWVAEADMLEILGKQLKIPYVHLKPGLFDLETARLLDKSSAIKLMVVPLYIVDDTVSLATPNPQDIHVMEEVEDRLGYTVRPVLSTREDVINIVNDIHMGTPGEVDLVAEFHEEIESLDLEAITRVDAIDDTGDDSPVIKIVNNIIQRAVHDGASDIHLEPSRNESRIRFRVDGVLYQVMTTRPELHPALISRLKVMAGLDISEKRLPQDGRIQVVTQGRPIDLRFSSLPGLLGEKVVLRVLDKQKGILGLEDLGMRSQNLKKLRSLLAQSYGLILVTGPTGSGKTTTLYSALNFLNSMEKNIVTVEDPVEYQLDIINQNEVRNHIGLNFSKMLKHILRQDPDIVMVGEIRDQETAEIAVQAALTGHLVLSTLHTNDSIGAISRMIDMNVEPYLLSSALLGVVAQRLVRTICPHCKTSYEPADEIYQHFKIEKDETPQLSKGNGCSKCMHTGYKGRVGIHEILTTTPELQDLVLKNPSRAELDYYLEQHNITTLQQDGIEHVKEQRTTLEEIERVVNMGT